jgi:ribosomal subunit interface protein
MKLDLKMRGLTSAPALRTYVERRLAFALDRHAERVARVRVTLEDVNGPKGGDDKRCRVDVQLRGGRSVRAAAQDAELHAAADVAIHRVARGLNRELDRRRTVPLDHRWLARTSASRAIQG